MTFVAGAATDVFPADFARAVDGELRRHFAQFAAPPYSEAYRSDDVDATGWSSLQRKAGALQLSADPYQLVYLPIAVERITPIVVPPAADPLQVGSLPALLEQMRAYAATVSLPTGDLELMQLATKYLEDDALYHRDLDVQTFVQLLLAAGQASAHGQPLWVVVGV